jgi:fasciclin domain-containing protein
MEVRMQLARRCALAASTIALAVGTAVVVAPPSSAAPAAPGHRSLAKVLTSDVLAVLKAKPSSPVSVLAKGRQRLTAFAPTDQAFRFLVYDLTGTWKVRERNVFKAVASLGIDTVETVLLYHVVPGATIGAKKALKADGADLTTAQGGTLGVDVLSPVGPIRLADGDPDDVDALTIAPLLNINHGNRQIAHGISFVLRPADL